MKTVALIDADAFYCSVFKVFMPHLSAVPVVVLSNNDGCVISRDRAAKALGVEMGEPFHLNRGRYAKLGITALSSNYPLFGDMSTRIAETLRQLAPAIEHYSIDESFVELPPGADPQSLAREMRRRVLRHTGVPVSIGLAPTKVLAKLAAKRAKKSPELAGVATFPTAAEEIDTLLDATPVADLWGIAGRLSDRLAGIGVTTARQFRDLPDPVAKRIVTTTGLRIAWELRGLSCIPLEEHPPSRKSVVRARSFGRVVHDLSDLREAVAAHTSRAAELLRREGLTTSYVTAFIATNPFAESAPQYSNAASVTLMPATDDTPTILHATTTALESIYRRGYGYQRAGVMFFELSPRAEQQLTFSDESFQMSERRCRLMTAMDSINRVYGRDTVRAAASGFDRRWRARAALESPRYTTQWDELPIANAT